MATLQELERALIGAGKAGDVEAAKSLAQAIKSARVAASQPTIPQEDPGFGQAALIGTGRTADRMLKGIKQMGLTVAAPFSDAAKGELANMDRMAKSDDVEYDKLRKIRPGATMLGEAAPLVAAPILGAGAAATAASAALPGLIEYGTGGERLARGAMGAVGGVGGRLAGNALARAIKPTAAVSAAQSAANKSAEKIGVKLTSGEASGNRALRWAEGASADMPIAAGIASKRIAGNDSAIAQAAAKSVGQQADEITPSVLSAARQEISGEFSRILNPLQVDLSGKATEMELKAVQGSKVLRSLRDESIDGLIDELRAVAKSGPVDGAWFQQNKTALDSAIRSSYNNGQPGKAKALELVDNALDRAAKKAMGKDSGAYEAARKKWANLRMLETGKVVDEGRVMPGRLKQAMETRYKSAFREGKIGGELTDISNLAGTLRGMPQSGTAPRAIYSGLVGGAAFAEPMTAASMVAAPSILQGITASPAMRAYMTKGVGNLTPEMERQLLAIGARGGLLGAYGANQ